MLSPTAAGDAQGAGVGRGMLVFARKSERTGVCEEEGVGGAQAFRLPACHHASAALLPCVPSPSVQQRVSCMNVCFSSPLLQAPSMLSLNPPAGVRPALLHHLQGRPGGARLPLVSRVGCLRLAAGWLIRRPEPVQLNNSATGPAQLGARCARVPGVALAPSAPSCSCCPLEPGAHPTPGA